MSTESADTPAVTFTVTRSNGSISDVHSSSPDINHFLRLLKLTRAYNTWLNYALDLKLFFAVVPVPPEAVGRPECLL